jgi:hypothetical protein
LPGWLTIEDVALAGLGLDIAGGCVLASGLLLSTRQIRHVGGSYYDWNRYALVDLVENRVKGIWGVALLVIGFTAQALTYLLTLGNVSPDYHDHWSVIAGICIVVAAAVIGAMAYTIARDPMVRAELVKLAESDGDKPPDLNTLASLAQVRWPATSADGQDESPPEYVKRIFGSAVLDHFAPTE